MDAIKFSMEVNVNLNLTPEMKSFFMKLFQPEQRGAQKEAIAEDAPTTTTTTAAEPEKKPEQKFIRTAGVGIEELRLLLASKVGDHREEIKAKLNELDAASLTKLSQDKYPEMHQFLLSL